MHQSHDQSPKWMLIINRTRVSVCVCLFEISHDTTEQRRLMHVRLYSFLHSTIQPFSTTRAHSHSNCVRVFVSVFVWVSVFFSGPNIAHKIYWQHYSFSTSTAAAAAASSSCLPYDFGDGEHAVALRPSELSLLHARTLHTNECIGRCAAVPFARIRISFATTRKPLKVIRVSYSSTCSAIYWFSHSYHSF